MSTLSEPTLGLLIEIADKVFTRSDLETLLMRSELRQYGQGGSNKAELLRSPFLSARFEAEQGDQTAHRALLRFVVLLLEKRVGNPELPSPDVRLDELREALLADGYQMRWDEEPDPRGPFSTGRYRFQLLPTDAAPAPLGPEISALETELKTRGCTLSLNHYQQAVDNFVHHNYEAANGQLRTALEALVTGLARQYAGYVGQGKPGEGGLAINHMVDTGSLPKNDGGLLLQGVWKSVV